MNEINEMENEPSNLEQIRSEQQCTPETPVSHGKKRGRPSKKENKEWLDEEVEILIDLWGNHECLYNSKHQLYMNKNARSKAMDQVIEGLKKENIEVNTKQVQEKLNKLRNYYGAERRKEEYSKVSGSGTDSVYTSSWRFYGSLHFLRNEDFEETLKKTWRMKSIKQITPKISTEIKRKKTETLLSV